MAENRELTTKEGELQTEEKKAAHGTPRAGRFHFRLRTPILLLVGMALIGWLTARLVMAQ